MIPAGPPPTMQQVVFKGALEVAAIVRQE